MKRRSPPVLPDHWTPKQVLAVFEMLDFVRNQLREQYHREIQHADRAAANPRQLPIPLDSDPPFNLPVTDPAPATAITTSRQIAALLYQR